MKQTFEISHDREFLQHFLTVWRTKSISPEMVEKLKENKESDQYAAYGYGRWLSLVNPDGKSLNEAERLLRQAGDKGVQDAKAALAQMCFDGRIEADQAMPREHARLMESSYKSGSELAQYLTLENTIYGYYGFQKDPALVADILQKHLEKNPGSDTIYYELLGQALEPSDQEAAEKAYRVSLSRGEIETYLSLANLYQKQGDLARAWEVAEEGAGKGAVNCHRFKAMMDNDDFLKLSPEQQKSLHEEIAKGLDYAIAHYDTFGCFTKGALLYSGQLGYPENPEEALKPLERGCEMGNGDCYWVKALIQDELGSGDVAGSCLQAVRLGNREQFTLDQIAKAYVSGSLSRYADEIEGLWLKEYVSVNPEDEDGKDVLGVIAVYPNGYYYAFEEEENGKLDLDDLAGKVDARGFDVVHYSPLLTRISKALCLDEKSCHVAMLVDKDGYMKDLPDNMPGTLVYGQMQEIRGTVIFVLEDDKTYTLMPMLGLKRIYMFIQLLTAATAGLLLGPLPEEP